MPGDVRPEWGHTWMGVALIFTERCTCPRASTAAVIVTKENQLLATGYNGAPAGTPHCTTVGCELVNGHCIRANHAEANALMQLAKLGIAGKGAVMYCTHRPCQSCIKLILQAGLSEVHYQHEYDSDNSAKFVRQLAQQAGLKMVKWGSSVLHLRGPLQGC